MKNSFIKISVGLAVLLVATASFAGTLKDARNGKTYKTVEIGDKEWMAENLNYQTGRSMCYENKPESCEKYGRLYFWDDAMAACPDGWHLPSARDFEELEIMAGQKAGDSDKAGFILKSRVGWKDYYGGSGNGADSFGFAALPAGKYNSWRFVEEGKSAKFWSSTEVGRSAKNANYVFMNFDSGVACVDLYVPKDKFAFSVRCIKND